MGRAKTASGAPACFLSGIFRAGSLYPLARGCRRIWRGEGWFRPARCCSTGSGRLDLDLLISGPRVNLFSSPLARARALMARPWSARCYGVARQREGSRQNSIGGSGVLSLRHFSGWFSLSLGAWVPKKLARRRMVFVMHVRDDLIVPIEAGRQMGAGIPGARFIALPGRNHLFLKHEPAAARFLDE